MGTRSKRSMTYVDSSVQGALLRRIFLHWCSFFVVVALATISMQALLCDPAVNMSDRLVAGAKSFGTIAVVMMSLLPAFMLDTIRFSNRFVGPVGRLRGCLRKLNHGNVERIQFRDNDFWIEMGKEFNAIADLVESQRNEIADLRKQLDKTEVFAR